MARIYHFAIRRFFLIGLLFISTVGCDQISKVVARDSLRYTQPLSYLGDSIRLQFAQNPGAFLSFGAEWAHGLRFWIFTFAAALMVAAAALALIRKPMTPLMTIALTLVVAGGVGNLIDRVAFGVVTDFLNIGIGHLRTGIFNVADMAIMAGGALLGAGELWNKQRMSKQIS